jgi:chemotaxis protein CheC
VRLVAVLDWVRVISEILPDSTAMTAVRLAFRCVAPGECFVLFGEHSAESLGRLTDHANPSSQGALEEMLLDVGNLLAGACVGGIAEKLGHDTTYGVPSILCVNEPIAQILDPLKVPWNHALVLRVNFKVEGESFIAHVLLFWPEKAIWAISQHLTAYLEGL